MEFIISMALLPLALVGVAIVAIAGFFLLPIILGGLAILFWLAGYTTVAALLGLAAWGSGILIWDL